ncbi:MAG: GT-D fold domain-containing glycosyltransferase [Spirochaetaceae bacterium]|nr:GT-D fold domain-containing glycosyltransferase [Spirochaetaceae bacterium]
MKSILKKIRYAFNEPLMHELNVIKSLQRVSLAPKTLSWLDTVNALINGKSVARYGDGELDLCLGLDYSFGKAHTDLTQKLRHILKFGPHENPNCLICLPADNLVTPDTVFWNKWSDKNFSKILPLLDLSSLYGDTNISRRGGEAQVMLLCKIWSNKKVVFVTSKEGRHIDEPRLFDNIAEKAFIAIPPLEAWLEYDTILAQCKHFDKDWIFYIAGGALATVLAYDLSMCGYQALDLGHLVNCFQQEMDNTLKPEHLPKVKN